MKSLWVYMSAEDRKCVHDYLDLMPLHNKISGGGSGWARAFGGGAKYRGERKYAPASVRDRSALTEPRAPQRQAAERDRGDPGVEVVSTIRVRARGVGGDQGGGQRHQGPKLTDPPGLVYPFAKTLTRNVSNSLKHLHALKASRRPATPTHHIVLEDDALAGDGWADALKSCLESRPEDADLVMLGIPDSQAEFQSASGL